MKKSNENWKISELLKKRHQIKFPEYQREPTIWNRSAKQRLIDSIVRKFDIASLYLYKNEDDNTYDCIDGRQRISAIRSFCVDNEGEDDGFRYKAMNEIYDDNDDNEYKALKNKSFADIKDLTDDTLAKKFVKDFNDYELTVVVLSDSSRGEEFNLQFTRLNLGVVLNSGEKLNAMIGGMRDVCFNQLANNSFLKSIKIPTRRYAQAQLAAQIVAQIFSLEKAQDGKSEEFTRVRYVDLQRFFKDYMDLDQDQKEWIEKLERIMSLLEENKMPTLRSRSMVLSLVLLAYKLTISKEEVSKFAKFSKVFVTELKEEVGRISIGQEMKHPYFFDFQKHLSQGSVERPAIMERHSILEYSYDYWKKHNQLPQQLKP